MTATRPFGPTALATPANAVTMGRLAAAPVLFAVVLASPRSWLSLALWVVLAGSDGADGILARRQGITRSGAFLDPLADKFLVLAAMTALVIDGRFSWVPVVLIGARELALSAYRSYAGRRSVSVPARPLAKVKTVVQDVAVGVALLPVISRGGYWVADSLLWVAVVLTLVTGAQYLLDGRTVMRAR